MCIWTYIFFLSLPNQTNNLLNERRIQISHNILNIRHDNLRESGRDVSSGLRDIGQRVEISKSICGTP